MLRSLKPALPAAFSGRTCGDDELSWACERDEDDGGRSYLASQCCGHGERSRSQSLFKLGGTENLSILAGNALDVNVLAVNSGF